MQPETSNIAAPLHRRSARHFARAKRHSRFVKLLKGVLPLSAAAITVAFIGMSVLSYTPLRALDMAGIGLEDGKLVMREPKLEGFDKNERPFSVKANRALQDLDAPDMIELQTIDASLAMQDGSEARVDARTGVYDSKAEKLSLRDGVQVRGANGMNIDLEDAQIDMKTGEMVSSNPVAVRSKEGNVTADSVHVSDNGKRIIFKERVRMVIQRPKNTATPEDAPSATAFTE